MRALLTYKFVPETPGVFVIFCDDLWPNTILRRPYLKSAALLPEKCEQKCDTGYVRLSTNSTCTHTATTYCTHSFAFCLIFRWLNMADWRVAWLIALFLALFLALFALFCLPKIPRPNSTIYNTNNITLTNKQPCQDANPSLSK